jgi:CheY-like chemotaxis protein
MDAECEKAHNRGKVLVVDDEERIVNLLKFCLESAGYEVLMAYSCVEALCMIEKHGCTIQALLSDVQMPMMTGDELVRTFKLVCPEARTALMTGYTERVLDPEWKVFYKPFSPIDVLKWLDEREMKSVAR